MYKIFCLLSIFLLFNCVSKNLEDETHFLKKINTLDIGLFCKAYNLESENEIIHQKDKKNNIIAVKSPIDRILYLDKKYTIIEFENLIKEKNHDIKYWTVLNNCLPDLNEWILLKEFLLENDEIWTIPGLDSGFVVIRNKHLIIMVIVSHSL